MNQSTPDRREAWLVSRLRDHRIDIDGGDTSRQVRADRARNAILREGLAPVVVCRSTNNRPMTYREVFEAIYSQPLEVPDGPA